VLSLAKLQKYAALAGCAVAMSLGIQSCQPKYEDPGVAQYHNPPIAQQISQIFPDLPTDQVASSQLPDSIPFTAPPLVAADPATPIQAALTLPNPPSSPPKIAPTTKLARILAGEAASKFISTPAPASSKQSASPAPNKTATSDKNSYRVAVAIDNPITQRYESIAQRTGYLERYPEIGSAETIEHQGQRLHKDAATAFIKMSQAAAKDQVSLKVISGFRSIRTQAEIFEGKGGGVSATAYSAPPGHSQHHTGLAIDINSLQPSFRTTTAFRWLKAHASEYGFMLPYANTSGDLGPSNEPWHWVYVGKPPAMKLMAAFLGRARQANYDPLDGNSQLEAIYRAQTATNISRQ
jgi:LAS superfamily LD-carboxypeptidase LdcB